MSLNTVEHLTMIENQVDLPAKGIEQAISLSQSVLQPALRWQSYLSLLAFSGFTEWVETYGDAAGLTLPYETHQARLILPTDPEQPAAIGQILLNQQFRLCLIATEGPLDETLDKTLELPQAIVDHPKQIAHFYVHVQVDTESNIATIVRFLRYDQLKRYRNENNLLLINGYYSIPLNLFESRIHRLFLLAHSLNPHAIVLPQTHTDASIEFIQQLVIQPIINTAQWMQRQLNQLNQAVDRSVQSLDSLLTLPQDFTPELIVAFRGETPPSATGRPTEANLSEMLQVVQQQGYQIPIEIRAIYQEVALEGQSLQLTIVSWLHPSNDSTEPEWSLLLIAQTPSPVHVPFEVRIQDAENILASTAITPKTYHILQAIGFLHEQFTIVITQANTELMLPPFKFEALTEV